MLPDALHGDKEEDELDNLDLASCKDKLHMLQGDRQGRLESTRRLQEKLKALNNELAARVQDISRSQKMFQETQARNNRLAKQTRELDIERGDRVGSLDGDDGRRRSATAEVERAEHVIRCLEQELKEEAHKRVRRNALGFRDFDETELMVEKTVEEQMKETNRIYTVLITCLVPLSETKYYMSYRVNPDMTSKQLRIDACNYWGFSEVDFVLKTKAGNKVLDEMSIQDCFLGHEEAWLLLVRTTPHNTVVSQKEAAAVKARGVAKATQNPGEKQENMAGNKLEDFWKQLASVPGLRDFMTQRDENVVSHLNDIRGSTCFFYLLFIILTAVAIFLPQVPDTDYLLRQGELVALTAATQSANAFSECTDLESLASWLMDTLPMQLFFSYVYFGILSTRDSDVSHAACEAS